MHSISIRDDETDAPRTIRNPLEPENIKRGVFIWHDGMSSACKWDCPAMIAEVNPGRREFRVLSLDDMKVHETDYDFVLDARARGSRKTMRIATSEEVKTYLANRLTGLIKCAVQKANEEDWPGVQKALANLEHFDEVRKTLKL